MCEFLTAYNIIIVNYDNTNEDPMPNSMKLIFLKLCIRQCSQLYIAYSNWTTTNWQAAITAGNKWKAKYDELYRMLREHAALIDKGSPNTNHRANLSNSFNPYDDFNNESRDDGKSINLMRSVLANKGVDPDVMDEFCAYKIQSWGR